MNTTKLILKLTAHTAGRKLTRADIRKLQMRIASLPSDKVNELMNELDEHSLLSSKELCRILLCSMSFRLRLPVNEMYTYSNKDFDELSFYLCPNCRAAIEFDFQNYCGSCGQTLGWDNCENVSIHQAGEQFRSDKDKSAKEPMEDKKLITV